MLRERIDGESKPRIIKLFVTPEDHIRLRLAAVISDQSVGAFCRELVLSKVQELTKDISLQARPGNRQIRKR